jgi:hypothetical protein
MINRQLVLEYLNNHPNHSTWQMRLHFLQANRQINSQSSVSISSIANQLNYILRDLESTGVIPQRMVPSSLSNDRCQSDYSHNGEHSSIDRQGNR